MNSLVLIIPLLLIFLFRFVWRLGLSHAEVNWGKGWLNCVDGLVRIFCHRYHRMPSVYLELPENGPAIAVSNHISGLDPLILLAASKRPLRFMIAREQYNRFGLKWLFKAAGCIPVDRKDRPERALREAFKALNEGEVVAIFPHGHIHWPPIPHRKLKGGAIRLAKKAACLVYPLYIDGVRLKGHTLLSVPIRSHLKVEVLPVIDCVDVDYQECLDGLAQILNNSK